MAGSVAPWPRDASGGSDRIPPADLFKTAVDEYRFQAQFNWSRTQYLLAFNAAILTAATVVASRPGKSAALVFLLGAVAAILSAVAVRTQHDYYRAARDRMTRVEDAFGVEHDHRLDTTATLGRRWRFISVTQIVYLLLASLAISNAIGFGIILARP